MKNSLLIYLGFMFFGLNALSQDTLIFLNGKTINGNITSTNDLGVSITTQGLLFKNTHHYYKDELFSMSIEGHKTLLYYTDSINGNFFSPEQMNYYIKGVQEGKEHYHAPFATLGGLATGITGGIYGFWGMTIPTAYVFITGIKNPKINMPLQITENLIADKQYSLPEYGMSFPEKAEIENINFNEPYYNLGYRTAAKDKKIKNAIRGGIIGFIAFVATSYIMVLK